MKVILLVACIFPLLFFWNTPKETDFLATDLKQDIQGHLVEAISGAKKSIEISIYSLSEPHVIQALKEKSQEGVSVRVLLDHKSTPFAAKKLGRKVKTTLLEAKGLMHHKIILIDGKEAWLGSANLTSDSLKVQSNLMQRIFSENLTEFIHQKLTSLRSVGKKISFPHKVFDYNGQRLECWFLPDDPHAALRIQGLIQGAKKTIRVAMYTFTRQDFCDALIKKAREGIKVEVVMDQGMCEGVCGKIWECLFNSPVQLYKSEGSALLHNKMMIIDEDILEHGSANWTKAAFKYNEDYFIVLSGLSSTQQQELQTLWQAILKRSILSNKSSKTTSLNDARLTDARLTERWWNFFFTLLKDKFY